MQLVYKAPAAQAYLSLRLRSGMGSKDLFRSQIALENSLFTVSLYDGEKLIGFGRIVGDGGITYIVSDIRWIRRIGGGGMLNKLCRPSTSTLKKIHRRTAIFA